MKEKKSPIYRYLKLVASIVISALILFVVVITIYFYNIFNEISTVHQDAEGNNIKDFIDDLLMEEPERITVAGFGVDKDGMRTDVIIVGTYETSTGEIDLISVPRDTYIELTDEMYEKLNNDDGYSPKVMKINELHAYSGSEWSQYVIPTLEDLLGLEIDHYVKIDLDAFRKIVDTMGGVEFYVPFDMYYSDPYQNLYIDLEEGLQTLDGKDAEMLIRYRYGYKNGDIGRIETQQSFMEAFASQLLNETSLIGAVDLIKAVYTDLEIDITLGETISYSTKYISKLDLTKMEMHTIPGQPEYISGRSYYVTNKNNVQQFINDLLYLVEDTSQREVTVDYNIQVLNGGSVNGIASRTGNVLTNEGYTVKLIGTFDGKRVKETRIIVAQEGMGKDLLKYFNNAEIIVESNKSRLPEGINVQIIIGLDEQ